MRVGIDANPMLGDRGGVGWHTQYLLQALLDLKEGLDVVCYVRPGSLRRNDRGILGAPGWEGHQHLQWVEAGKLGMRRRGRLDRLDLYHGTNFKLQTTGRCGGIVTIHDLWLDRFPQYSTKLFGQRASFFRTRRTARKARLVITVSDYSAREIASLYGLPREKIVVIPNGVSDDFRPAPDPAALSEFRRRFMIPTERFILFVGGADPRKNHQTLLKACARRAALLKDHSLVLVGDAVHRFGDMRQSARVHGLGDRAVCPGRLPIEALRQLYAHAAVFVFPSIYEGFGMPVLEAMACGAPVVTSRTTALPEVAGDAALLVDPEDVDAIGEAIVRLVEDRGLRDRLRAKGFEHVKLFTWERAARSTMALYRKCAEEPREGR